jgi:hypothetical protein
MQLWRIFLAIAMATLWVAAGSHCRLEILPGLGFLSCCQHSQAEKSPAHHDDDCAGDGCFAIESGFYKIERTQNAPIKPLLPLAVWLNTASDDTQSNAPAFAVLGSSSPPEVALAWQFFQRAALPPRAPSFVS